MTSAIIDTLPRDAELMLHAHDPALLEWLRATSDSGVAGLAGLPRATFKAVAHPPVKGGTMGWDDEEDTTIYKAVVNHEEQYSIWPAHRENPPGWRDAGRTGTKAECLEFIQEVWTDMRPLSLRKKMEEANAEASADAS